MQIKVNPEHKSLSGFVEEVATRFPHEGTTIYKDRNEVKILNHEGHPINVKQYAIPNVINRFVYVTLRLPKAVRAYNNAIYLKELGISTPEPIGYVLDDRPLYLHHSYLVTQQSPYRRSMYEFGQGGTEGREEILEAFVDFTVDLHRKGVYHLDYSPGNILFDKVEGEWCFTIVDINRMRFGEVTLEDGCRSFARLWGGDDFVALLAHHYAKARSADEDEVRSLIQHHRNRFWCRRRHRDSI